MASDGGPMYPIKGTQHWGASVRDAFAMVITSHNPDRRSTEVYDLAQGLTNEKLLRDRITARHADRDERKPD